MATKQELLGKAVSIIFLGFYRPQVPSLWPLCGLQLALGNYALDATQQALGSMGLPPRVY